MLFVYKMKAFVSKWKITGLSSDLLIADRNVTSIGFLPIESFPHSKIQKNPQDITHKGVKVKQILINT